MKIVIKDLVEYLLRQDQEAEVLIDEEGIHVLPKRKYYHEQTHGGDWPEDP